jgi:hypothetical protein
MFQQSVIAIVAVIRDDVVMHQQHAEEGKDPVDKEDAASCRLHNFVLMRGSPNKRAAVQCHNQGGPPLLFVDDLQEQRQQ